MNNFLQYNKNCLYKGLTLQLPSIGMEIAVSIHGMAIAESIFVQAVLIIHLEKKIVHKTLFASIDFMSFFGHVNL